MFQKPISTALFALALMVLLASGCTAGPAPAPSTPPPAAVKTAVTAKAAVVPIRYADLAFSAGGTLAQVQVKQGTAVKAGAVLAQLDTRDLELGVREAQDALALAQSRLAQAKAAATAEEIASVQASYDSALIALKRAQQGPSQEESVILAAKLAKARAALERAQAAYDQAGGSSIPFIGMLPISLDLQTASLDHQIAQAEYDKGIKVDAAAIADAQAAVAQAKAELDLKKKGPRAEDVAVAQVGVQQAQTGLEQAQAALAKAKLIAPFDGIVTDVNLRPGELVQSGAAVATLADLSQLRVETTDLDEFGAAQVRVGQPVSISVNALNDRALTGKVEAVSLQSVVLSTGDTSYVVTVALDKQDPDLRWGMTVKVDFGSGQ